MNGNIGTMCRSQLDRMNIYRAKTKQRIIAWPATSRIYLNMEAETPGWEGINDMMRIRNDENRHVLFNQHSTAEFREIRSYSRTDTEEVYKDF